MKLNIDILRARDQEAKVLRADQKKKISKLQDKVRTLQAELREQQQQTNQRRKILSHRVRKLKAEHLTANSGDAFNPVTKAQLKLLTDHFRKQIMSLLKRIMILDEIIHKEQLCMPWSLPENFDSRLASLVHDLCDGRRSLASTKSSSSEALQEASSLLRRKALGIETENELDQLFHALILFTYCQECNQKPFDINAECAKHKPYLEAQNILAGLKKFSRGATVDSETNLAQDSQKSSSALLRGTKSKSEESVGWSEFLKLLPDDLEEKWDSLYVGMNQHLAVLSDRHEVNEQVGRIKKQNAELRHLLEMHTMAKLLKKQQTRALMESAD
ncbi:dynein regulatory complex protein 1-like [Neocloeon triangulifer]|uniref:dynein regulatory complex protein 1-like n=1 Tax=Neocloeon triangulifer TaxID=2078957 RepID=UPI00286F17AC|nr:dynein regulatory complex protein 1-like [Neocloeon triangulifer]